MLEVGGVGCSLSRAGFSVVLKSPSQTADIAEWRTMNDSPSLIMNYYKNTYRPCGSVDSSHNSKCTDLAIKIKNPLAWDEWAE